MNAVGADQDIATHGLDMAAGAIEEIGCHATFVLGEGAEPAAGVDRILAQPLLDGAVDHALQPAAMDRELRHVVAGIDAAHVAPDFLAVAIEVIKHVGADRDVIELLQEAEAGELADRMWQRIDTDAELPDRIRCSNNSQPMPRARNISAVVRPPMPPPTIIAFIALLHSHPDTSRRPLTSHGASLGRKRLCGLRLQLGPGLWLSLNFQILEILPVADAVAENLLLAGQILGRAEHPLGAIPGRGL